MSNAFHTLSITAFSGQSYLQPWKLVTFVIGLGLLIAGSFFYVAPDWDIGISILMATLTYLTAPWAVRIVISRQWSLVPLALVFYYVTVDGSYLAYWILMNPDALFMREANFYASTCLYWLCGFIWLHDGKLRDLLFRPKVWSEVCAEALDKSFRSGGVADRSYLSECFFHINAPDGHRMGVSMTYEEWVHSIEVTKANQQIPTILLKDAPRIDIK